MNTVDDLNNYLDNLSDDMLVKAYDEIVKKLSERKIISSANVTGDLGEFLAIRHYNSNTPELPKLEKTPPSTKAVDALNTKGERYNIKTTTSNNTGSFHDLQDPDSKEPDKQKFDYVVIVILDKFFRLKRINELTWEQFLNYKKWHKTNKAWQITITKKLLSDTRTIYQAEL